MAVRYLLIHHHIFKNAGSTVDWILKKNFLEGFAEIHHDSGFITKSFLYDYLKNNPTVVCLSSHHFHTRVFNDYTADDFEGSYVFLDIVLIRHPLDRLASIYRFLRTQTSGDEITEAARSSALPEFLLFLIERHPNQINNVQTTILSKMGYYAWPPDNSDLLAAGKKIRKFALIGAVDNFNLFCVSAEYFLQPCFKSIDFSYKAQNISSNHTEEISSKIKNLQALWGEKLFSTLLDYNQLDVKLWELTRTELERRTRFIPNLEDRMKDFERRCNNIL